MHVTHKFAGKSEPIWRRMRVENKFRFEKEFHVFGFSQTSIEKQR